MSVLTNHAKTTVSVCPHTNMKVIAVNVQPNSRDLIVSSEQNVAPTKVIQNNFIPLHTSIFKPNVLPVFVLTVSGTSRNVFVRGVDMDHVVSWKVIRVVLKKSFWSLQVVEMQHSVSMVKLHSYPHRHRKVVDTLG